MPFASAGLLAFSADPYARLWLTLTPAGRQAADGDPPDDPADAWGVVEAAAAAYDAAFAAEWQALATAKADHPNNLIVPHRCGAGWGSFADVLQRCQREKGKATA